MKNFQSVLLVSWSSGVYYGFPLAHTDEFFCKADPVRDFSCAQLNFVSMLSQEMGIQFLSQEALLDFTIETLRILSPRIYDLKPFPGKSKTEGPHI